MLSSVKQPPLAGAFAYFVKFVARFKVVYGAL